MAIADIVSSRYGIDFGSNLLAPVKPIVPPVFIPQKQVRAISSLMCGIEIEVENTRFPVAFELDFWKVTDDGSLRNNGAEFITHMGTAVGHLQEAMLDLNEYIEGIRKKHKNTFIFTERCSVHVHLDIRNFTEEMLEALVLVYTLYEDQLFKMCDPLRSCNVFCIPLRNSTINLMPAYADIWELVQRFSKYSAINFEAARRYGSVEFRHHEGTFSVSKICNWVYMLALMRYYAERVDIKDLRERIMRLKTESAYEELTREIFHGYAPEIMERTVPAEMDMAVSDAKQFFMGEV